MKVLCGLLKLNCCQMLIGLTPIFCFTTPGVLLGAFMTEPTYSNMNLDTVITFVLLIIQVGELVRLRRDARAAISDRHRHRLCALTWLTRATHVQLSILYRICVCMRYMCDECARMCRLEWPSPSCTTYLRCCTTTLRTSTHMRMTMRYNAPHTIRVCASAPISAGAIPSSQSDGQHTSAVHTHFHVFA